MWEWLDEVLSLLVIAAVVVLRWRVKADIERSVDKKFREWEVRFSVFHTRLVDAMDVIRRRLAEAIRAVRMYAGRSYLTTEDNLTGELDSVGRFLDEVRFELDSRQFYFDSVTRENVRNVIRLLFDISVKVATSLEAKADNRTERANKILEELPGLTDDLDAAKEKLDKRFRAIVRDELQPVD